eukprot:9118007-Ditylum_brightwellii.AAC.1
MNDFDLNKKLEERTNEHFIALYDLHTIITGKTYADLTGCFPVTSTSGNNYILVLYDYDSNAILAMAMKNRTEGEIIRVYNTLYEHLVGRGLTPKFQVLDNEVPKAIQHNITVKR